METQQDLSLKCRNCLLLPFECSSSSVSLNWEKCYFPEHIRQCLGTFLVVRSAGVLLHLVEDRDAAKYSAMPKTAPQQRVTTPNVKQCQCWETQCYCQKWTVTSSVCWTRARVFSLPSAPKFFCSSSDQPSSLISPPVDTKTEQF